MKPVIEISNLYKQFTRGGKKRYLSLRETIAHTLTFSSKDNFWALEDINIKVEQGERLGIIGHNGAGKTTLLKILSRITPPTKGSVLIRGKVSGLLEVGTGFHPELSGRENIFFNGAVMGMNRWEIRKNMDSIIDFSGVGSFIDTPLKHYSTGMSLRLAFAVASHLETDIMMIDEILAVGDVEFQKKCLLKMDEISGNTGKTLLLVSHNMGTIQTFCDRALILNKGQLECIGESQQIVQNYLRNFSASKSGHTRLTGGTETYITEVKILNSRKETGGCMLYGEPFDVCMKVYSTLKVNNLSVVIGLNNCSGDRILTSVSTQCGKTYDIAAGDEQEICAAIKPTDWMLKPGIYSLYLSIFTNKSVRLDSQIIEQFIEISETAWSADRTYDSYWGMFRIDAHWY